MNVLDSAEKLATWEDYREFLKENLKLADGEGSCFVSKDKLEFTIQDHLWKGHAFLAGKHAEVAVQKLKAAGVIFRRGSCSLDGKTLRITDLEPDKLVKEAQKTLLKLQLGYKIEFAASVPDESAATTATDGAAPAAAPETRAVKLDELKKLKSDIERLLAALKK